MKKLVIIAVLIISATTMAQDIIITKDGDPLKVWGLEVSNSAVFYRESEAEDAPIKRIKKEDLLMIKYQDGRKEVIESSPATVPQATAPTAPTISVEDPAANETAIQRFNTYNDIEYTGKKTSKTADMLYCVLKAKPTSVILDKNVEVSVVPTRFYKSRSTVMDTRNNYPQGCAFVAEVKNRSSQTVYIDLGTSFFIRGSQAEPMYVPQAVTSTTSKTTGASVNMGAVARAAGVGGAVGTLANGVTVGGASTNGTSTITYSQRVIAIPPFSSQKLDEMYLFPDNSNQIFGPDITAGAGNGFVTSNAIGNTMEWTIRDGGKLQVGEMRELPAENNPVCFTFHFTYSFSEDISTPHVISLQLYTAKIFGANRRSAMSSNFKEMVHDIFPEKFRDIVSYMCVQR